MTTSRPYHGAESTKQPFGSARSVVVSAAEGDPRAADGEQKAIAELAFELGARYENRRFDDHAPRSRSGTSSRERRPHRALAARGARRRGRDARALPRLGAACRRRLSGREARDLDRDRGHDRRAPRHRRAARALAARDRGRHGALLLRLHRARRRLEREPARDDRRPRRRPAGASTARRPTSRRSSRRSG